MSIAQCFPSVSAKDARVLILGSMPGQLSLEKQQYYAHPRNGFWQIMGQLFGFAADAPYNERLQYLVQNHVALWDVLQVCFRPGSLDSSIDGQSIVVNDFLSFLKLHPTIHSVFFNGAKAEQLFVRYVVPELAKQRDALFMLRLPSTSPANAQLTLSEKAQQWHVVKQHALMTVL